MVKAYYMDEVVADPRATNEQVPPTPARFETLNLLNCFYKFYDPKEHFAHYNEAENAHINNAGEKDDDYTQTPVKDNKTRFEKEFVYPLMKELQYKHYDLITVSEAALGGKFETISTSQWQEHIHEDDEVRVIISGEGYFDIRDPLSGNFEHHNNQNEDNNNNNDKIRYAYLSQLYRQITDSAANNKDANHFEEHKNEILKKWEHLLDAPHVHRFQLQQEEEEENENNNNNNHTKGSKQPPPLPAGPHEHKYSHHHHNHNHKNNSNNNNQNNFQFRNKWIRIAVTAGDCLIVPKGIYHRFTTTNNKHITALRLFKDNPKWVSLSSPEGDSAHNKDRREYLRSILFKNIFCYETAVGAIAAPYYFHNSYKLQNNNNQNEKQISIFNQNVFSFQAFYPEEVNTALQRILFHFISNLKQNDNNQNENNKIIFYFTASKTPMTGQPWCPDCVRSHPFVKEYYHHLLNQNNNNNQDNNNNILYCEFPVERPAYKNNPAYYFRTHSFFQLNNVPTVFVLNVKPSVLAGWDSNTILHTINNNQNNNNNNNNNNELLWTEWVDVKLKTVDPTVEELVKA